MRGADAELGGGAGLSSFSPPVQIVSRMNAHDPTRKIDDTNNAA